MYKRDSRKTPEQNFIILFQQPFDTFYPNFPPPPTSTQPVTLRHDYTSWPPLTGLREHTQAHHNRQNLSGREISPSKRPLPDNTPNRQDIHTPGGVRTHNRSKRAATHLSLRPTGKWDPFFPSIMTVNSSKAAPRFRFFHRFTVSPFRVEIIMV